MIREKRVPPFTVDTLGGIVSCEVSEDASVISVEMGQVSFHSGVVPVKLEGEAKGSIGRSNRSRGAIAEVLRRYHRKPSLCRPNE